MSGSKSDKKIPLLEHTLNHGEEAIQQLRKHLALTLGEMSNEVNDKDLKDERDFKFELYIFFIWSFVSPFFSQ